jgi:hypothetical protein
VRLRGCQLDYLKHPGDGRKLPIDVVIPALNEAPTIGDVIKTFKQGDNVGNVIVVNDLSTDRTSIIARKAGAIVVKGPGKGKGEALRRGLREVTTPRVIFADADLHGLQLRHVNALASPAFGMIVGFRDLKRFNFLTVGASLPPIAGERAMPTRFVRTIPLTGFGAEMQINRAVAAKGMNAYHFIMLGVTGQMRAGPARLIDVAPFIGTELMKYGKLVRWLTPV